MKIKTQLTRFNQIYKEMDIVYHNYAKSLGLSDTAFWILYCISENENALTQRELCNYWSLPPQTVNSALKDIEKRGLITLDPVTGNKKNKLLHLTSVGEELVSRVMVPLIQAEEESFNTLSDEECEQMLSLTKRYSEALRKNIEDITK